MSLRKEIAGLVPFPSDSYQLCSFIYPGCSVYPDLCLVHPRLRKELDVPSYRGYSWKRLYTVPFRAGSFTVHLYSSVSAECTCLPVLSILLNAAYSHSYPCTRKKLLQILHTSGWSVAFERHCHSAPRHQGCGWHWFFAGLSPREGNTERLTTQIDAISALIYSLFLTGHRPLLAREHLS